MTYRTPIQGIFCKDCSAKKSLKATIVTWILGWWGFPWGPIYSLHAIFVNLFGGEKPKKVNSRILGYQAYVFVTAGQIKIARAILLDALKYASGEIRTSIESFQKILDDGTPPVRFKKTSSIANYLYITQIIILLGISLSIGLYFHNESNYSGSDTYSYNRPSSTYTPPPKLPKIDTNYPLSVRDICELQEILYELGYYDGKIDGLIGLKSINAIKCPAFS